ncbi:uncharacterized protein LOC144646227 [Oculina patagonica]
MVDVAEQRYAKDLKKATYYVNEIKEMVDLSVKEDLLSAYEKICDISKTLEASANLVKDAMLEAEKSFEEVKGWSQARKVDFVPIHELRSRLANELSELEKRELHKREEDWFAKKVELEMELEKKKVEQAMAKPQAVKLQKYTITPFHGDCKDWLRFWNQFVVEVDSSKISEISKFNYLLELVEGEPREHILGLPHTPEGYNEAKKILEMTFGKDIKVHKALINDLEALPKITSVHKIREVHEFYKQLSKTVRTLATMKKLEGAQSYVYSIMDKLGPVREAMAQKDDDWEEWGLMELVDNLRKYTDRNPLPLVESSPPASSDTVPEKQYSHPKREDKLLMSGGTSRQPQWPPPCVYCSLKNHRSSDCTKVLDIASRREHLARNKLCYNCAKPGHLVSKCEKRGCGKCKGRHHTSICDRMKTTLSPHPTPVTSGRSERFYGVVDAQTTLHATVIAKISGIQARIMLDSGAGSSYISSNLLTKLNLKPYQTERRVIEQMYGTVDRQVEIYKVTVESNVIEGFGFELECINAEKPVLTHLPNPRISELKKANHRIRRLNFSEEAATEDNLPVHVILGAADIQRIKTTEPAVLGTNPDADPGAEFTMLGWTITGKSMLSGTETEKGFFLKSSQDEFKQMCSQEVLGLSDEPDEQGLFHEDFKNQLQRLEDGTYSTRLPWKSHQLSLPSNRELTLGRLQSTTRKLERMQKLEEYHTVMEQQLEEGILELVPEVQTGEVIHYIPHQAVIREEAESTKMRIVYDCSAKRNPQSPSLNDCLEVGPPLQPAIFDILLRNRMKPFCITGDIQKAFLQIKISPEDRDALRLLWYDDLKERNIVQYRFTRVIFGSGPSPYILGATLEKHISQYEEKYPETVNELLLNTYVDDVQSGGDGKEELLKFKEEATEIMGEGGFQLHKWHSNIPGIEKLSNNELEPPQVDSTYAKETVGTQPHESKILGVPWDKEKDTFSINFAKALNGVEKGPLTKRKMLSAINSIFDLLGIAAPVVIVGKILYSEVCLRKLNWDEEVPEDIRKPWAKWLNDMKKCPYVSISRSVVGAGLTKMILHGFADASKLAVSVAVYTLAIHTSAPVQQTLLVGKSRIAPRDQTIPRLELVAAHTLSKLMHHLKEVLKDQRIEEYHCWVDSTTVLYWIKGQGTWSQFVRNRTKAIQDKEYLQWHYVPTGDNPSDQGSRGVAPSKMGELWFRGPEWLSAHDQWPDQPEVSGSPENDKERVTPKHEKQFLVKEMEVENETRDTLLGKYTSYWKLLRVTAFVMRFINNCRKHKKQKGPLMTEELQAAENFWIIQAQAAQELKSDVKLRADEEGILRCVGRVPNYHPVFLPRNSKLAALIVQQVHEQMLHGGVSTTMCHVRENYWVPKLRSLAKTVIHNCNLCKRYWKKPISTSHSPDSILPSFRTELSNPFTATGVDFAGPVYYKITKSTTSKAYIALFTCASTRAVHLKLCRDLSAEEFQRALKEFVARRGCPQTIVSDNGKTFVATGKWLSKLKKDQSLADYLGTLEIKWRFNLARAPWWGGFFERLIGIMKRSLSKVVGKSLLTFQELEEVLLDVEMTMNNRPLLYQGEEFEKPVLTPNTLLRGEPIPILEEDLEKIGEENVTKRMRFLEKSKQHLRKRFMKEYVHALEERQQKSEGNTEKIPDIGAVVMLKGEAKDKAMWKLGRVVSKITGKDGTVRGLKLKQGNGYIVERPLQLVCNLEIGGEDPKWKPNPEAEVFVPRVGPSRRAKQIANDQIRNIVEQELKDD